MVPSLISTHKGDVNGSVHRIALLGKEMISLSGLNIIAYDASVNDGPRTLPNGQPSILIHGQLSRMDLNIGPEYQQCFKPSRDGVWLSAHVFASSGVDWDPKYFFIFLQNLDDIHDVMRAVVDRDDPFSTYGEH
jgi:hypothetical protein